ncbi:hypothetical protein BIW11_02651 [Tropilaelaps mercedesae]|uniref:Uncharacterized protein n=1 Tax=Tropilaelaps mercedesae TaxID=418985 RepID=A0A1V9XZF2_9ACAR|nr:hypothetical protein BIW11_02651 [Tropilaelaps mercedesae]
MESMSSSERLASGERNRTNEDRSQ